MKTLKGLLTVVLILGMSTGFAAPSVGEQTFQATENNPGIEMRFVNRTVYTDRLSISHLGYDDLSESGQKEADKVIAEFCATVPEDITYYQNKLESSTPYLVGSLVGIGSGAGLLLLGDGMMTVALQNLSGPKQTTALIKSASVGAFGILIGGVGVVSTIYSSLYKAVRADQKRNATKALEKFCNPQD